jgi:hypothetical protein
MSWQFGMYVSSAEASLCQAFGDYENMEQAAI